MDIRDYKYISPLGSGRYGIVDLYIKDGKKYAIKKIECDDDVVLIDENYLTEINCYQRCNDPHVVKMIDTFKEGNCYIIIMECGDGHINDISLPDFDDEAYQILLGLYHLHSNGIMHCDIKHNNIIIFENRVAFTDFGLSKFNMFNTTNYSSDYMYAVPYRAPELLLRSPIDSKVEAWATGILFYTMYFGKFPYLYLDDGIKIIFETFGTDSPNNNLGKIKNPHLLDLITNLLNTDPVCRYSIVDALNHPFFNKVNNGQTFNELSPKDILDKYDFKVKYSKHFQLIKDESGPLSLTNLLDGCLEKTLILAIQIALRLLEKMSYDKDIFIISLALSLSRYEAMSCYYEKFEALPNYKRLQDKIMICLNHLDYRTIYTTPCDYILLYENIYSEQITDNAEEIALKMYMSDEVYHMSNYEIANSAMRQSCNKYQEIFDPIY